MTETQKGLTSAAEAMVEAKNKLSAGGKLVAVEVLRKVAGNPRDVPAEVVAKALELADTTPEDREAAVSGPTPSPQAAPALGEVGSLAFEQIVLVNFRSFAGEQTLDLSTDSKRPITLVFGPNGAGKTTLLNAFTWCLFGSFTKGFNSAVPLRSFDAATDAEVSVTVRARHNGRIVVVKRTEGVPNPGITIDGVTKTKGDLQKIFPPALKEMFFFPAETFNEPKIIRDQTSAAHAEPLLPIRKSIISLLNGERFKTCNDLLKAGLKQDALKVPQGSDAALEAAEERKNQALAKVFDLKKQAEDLPVEVESLRIKADEAEELAKQVDRKAVQEYKDKELKLATASDKADALVDRLDAFCTIVFTTAPAVLVGPSSAAAVRHLDRAENMGILPPLIDPRILQRCLDDDHCHICNEPFGTGTHERFEKLKEKADLGINARVSMSAREGLVRLSEDAGRSLTELRAEAQAIASDLVDHYQLTEIGTVDNDAGMEHLVAFATNTFDTVNSVSRDARNYLEGHRETAPDTSDANDKLNLWNNAKNKHEELAGLLEKVPALTEAAEALFDRAEKEYAKLAAGNAGNAGKVEAQTFLREALQYYETAQKALSTGVREDVKRQMNLLFDERVQKAYFVDVDENFQINPAWKNGDTAHYSQSEKVLLLLCFIATISRLAPRWQRLGSANVNPHDVVGNMSTEERGGLPVCIDAPLSPFDGEYEDIVIEKIMPVLANQTLVFVTKKAAPKWEGIKEHIGKTYVMRLTAADQKEQAIDWHGVTHEYTVPDNSTECRTEFRPI